MTFGEQLLCELAKLIPVDSYLNAEQLSQLKQIDSKGEFEVFLRKHGLTGIVTDDDISRLAARYADAMVCERAIGTLGCEGALLWPFALQVLWLINAVKTRRFQFSLGEILTFFTLLAACLSYEVSIAPLFLDMPERLLFALPVAIGLGVFPAFFLCNTRWIIVSLEMIITMEIIVFAIWWRS